MKTLRWGLLMQQNKPGQAHNRVLLYVVGLLIIITLLLFVPFQPPWPKVLECSLYLLCFQLLATYPPLRSLYDALPRRQRWAMLGLAGILVITQLRDRPTQTFPFLPWNMYHGRFIEPPHYLEYIGVCPDGREIAIPVGQLFLSQHRTVLWRLQVLWKQMEAATVNTQREQYAEQFRSLLLAVVSRFNDLHPGDDITLVRVMYCTMPRPVPGLKLEVTRRLVGEYPIS